MAAEAKKTKKVPKSHFSDKNTKKDIFFPKKGCKGEKMQFPQKVGRDWVGIGSGLGRDWVGIGSGGSGDAVGIG